MTRELYIDNQRVDLPDDARFQLTFQIADFGEMKPRGSGSNTIRLPKTPRNTDIFDNCNFVQAASDYPYLLHSAYYYEDGWLVFNDATVYMLAITDTDFEIQCVWGNAPEITRLKALDMGNVGGLGNVNYDADAYAAVETGWREYQGEWQRFPLSVRGTSVYSPYTRGVLPVGKALDRVGFKTDNMTPAIKAYLDGMYVFPAVKSAKKAYRNVDFTYPKRTTELSDEPSTRGTYAGGLFNWGSSGGSLGEGRKTSFFFQPSPNAYTSLNSNSISGITPLMPAGRWYDVTLRVTIYDVQLGNRDKSSYDVDRSQFKMAAVLGQVMGEGSNAYWNDTSNTNALAPASNDSTLVIKGELPASGSGAPPVMLSASKRLYVSDKEVNLHPNNDDRGVPPVYLSIYPYPTTSAMRTVAAYAQVTAEATLSVSIVGGEIEEDIHMPEETDEARNYITVGFSDVLRGVSAYDFVTQAIINAGAIFDHKDGTTRVYTYDDIANNGEGMLDWSDKLVYIKEENTFNQSGGSRNWVKYKPSEYYNGFGDGNYTDYLAEKLMKEDKTVVENRMFGFPNDNKASTPQQMPSSSIPMFVEKSADDGTVTYEFKESGFHLVKLAEYFNTAYLVNGAGREVYGNQKVLVSATQPTFDNIKARNWDRYIAMQQRYRKAKAVFMLNGQDIAQLDFKRPIYLRQYAQAYVVTKVNYQSKASTVEMILIR